MPRVEPTMPELHEVPPVPVWWEPCPSHGELAALRRNFEAALDQEAQYAPAFVPNTHGEAVEHNRRLDRKFQRGAIATATQRARLLYIWALGEFVDAPDELPHERNARLRREAVEGGEVQP